MSLAMAHVRLGRIHDYVYLDGIEWMISDFTLDGKIALFRISPDDPNAVDYLRGIPAERLRSADEVIDEIWRY
jgi:hypothetical protein